MSLRSIPIWESDRMATDAIDTKVGSVFRGKVMYEVLDINVAKKTIAHKEWLAFSKTVLPNLAVLRDRVITWHVDAWQVAVVCYKRPADLCNMQVVEGFWQLDMRGFTCQPLGYGKTELHNPVPPIKIDPFLKDPRLCPVYHLVRLERSLVKLRPKSETRLWLSSRQPHKAVTPTTMCGWLKQVIVDTGSLSGTARDVRSVGASTAVQARIDIKGIMEAANWQRLSTLQRYYFKPQSLQSLSNILNVTS